MVCDPQFFHLGPIVFFPGFFAQSTVSHIQNGEFPASHVSFREVYTILARIRPY